MKKGRFTKTEQEFIKITIEKCQISNGYHLDRDPVSVQSYVKEKIGNTTLDDREIEALHDLQGRPSGKTSKSSFRKKNYNLLSLEQNHHPIP